MAEQFTPFIFDDQITVIDNETITSLWPLVGTITSGSAEPRGEPLTTAQALHS